MPKRASVDDYFAQLTDTQRPHLKALMRARVEEYAATGAGWNDR